MTFAIDPPDAGWTRSNGQTFHLLNMAMLRDGLEYLPPGAERRLFYGPYNELPDTLVRLTVTYNRKERAKTQPEFSETFSLDRTQFEGMLHSTPYERQVLRTIESAAKNLKTIAQEAKRANRDGFANGVPDFIRPDLEADELLRQCNRGALAVTDLLEEVVGPSRRVRVRQWLREKLRSLHR